MPFIAIHKGKKKAPRQVGLDEEATCPTCGETVTVRRQSEDGRARHFWHSTRAGGGGGGGGGGDCSSVAESDVHMKWKSFAADRLAYIFEDRVLSCQMERELDAPLSDKNHRKADAMVLFDDRHPILGQGVVIEVQHKNNSKDIAATSRDYIEQDLAVVWSYEDDFTNDRCVLEKVDILNRANRAAHSYYCDRLFKQISRNPGIDITQFGSSATCDATIPPEYYDDTARELWEAQDWGSLFEPGAEKYILEGLLADLPVSKPPLNSLPQPVIDERIYLSDAWHEYPTASDQIAGQPIPDLTFDATLPVTILQKLFYKSRNERLNIPPTAFDDVQCHVCGAYRYAPTAPEKCETCGTPYDWEWNVSTGRVSKQNSPL